MDETEPDGAWRPDAAPPMPSAPSASGPSSSAPTITSDAGGGPTVPSQPPEWRSAVAPPKRPVVWIVVAALFVASTGVLAFLYLTTRSDLADIDRTLADTRTALAKQRDHVVQLDAKLASTSSKLADTQDDLVSARGDLKDLDDDLKVAEVCLKGFEEIGNASSQQQVFSILVRIHDECKAAYQTVHDNLPA